MASSACLSRTSYFSSRRASSRRAKPCPSIRPAPFFRAKFACTRDAAVHSSAALQTLTVDEEFQIEIAYLQAQVDELTEVRDRILGLDAAPQVRSIMYHLAIML